MDLPTQDPSREVDDAVDMAERTALHELAGALARERLLSAVGREVSAAGDIAAILERVLDHLAGVVRFKGGTIALIDTGELGIVAARGILDSEARNVRVRVGDGIAGWVAAHAHPYRSDDLDAESEVQPAARAVGSNALIRSYLAVPLVAHGHVLGILQIDSAERAAFTQADQALLEAVAAQIANAVERARLQDIVRRQTDTLAARNEELRHRTDALAAQNEELRAAAERLAAQNEELQTQRRELAARAARIEELVALAGGRAAELEATIDSISDGVWIVRRDGSLLVNRAAMALYDLEGRGPVERIDDIGRLMEVTYLDGTPVERDDLPLAHALRGEPIEQREELVITRATGQGVPVSVSSAPVYDSSGAVVGAVSIHRDITRLRETHQMRNQFIATASHELRTPVTSIKGLVQLTARRLQRDGDVSRALQGLLQIETQVNRMIGLVDDLLDISRIESNRLELRMDDLDLVALVDEATGRLQTTTERHRLIVQAPNAPLPVHGDAYRLDQVLDNLLSNAIKYSPGGGDIEVALRREGAEALVTVRDRGIGIPSSDHEAIFGRFGRAGNASIWNIEGFGLGLFISREIAQRHGGRLWLANSGDDGSTFALALPLLPSQVTP